MQSVFLLALSLGCIGAIGAIKCYRCTGGIEPGCRDPFIPELMSDSEKIDVGDTGICSKSKIESSGVSLVERNALTSLSSFDCAGGTNGCKKAKQNGVSGIICCCTSDLCNGVTSVTQQSLVLSIVMSIVIIAMHQLF